jgi:hypothetical protein
MENNVNLADLIYESLVSTCKKYTFGYGKYGDFKIIIRNDGYINATKLCALGKKEYKKWSRLDVAKKHIAFLEKAYGGKQGPNLAPVQITECISLTSTNPNDAIISGTYVHHRLTSIIAGWVSVEFAQMAADIVDNYMISQYKKQIVHLEQEKAVAEQKSIVLEKEVATRDTIIVEKDDKISALMAKMDAMRNEQKEMFSGVSGQLDEVIGYNRELLNNTDDLNYKVDGLTHTNNILKDQTDQILTTLGSAVETRVPPAVSLNAKEALALFKLKQPIAEYTHYISCGQPNTIKGCIARYGEPIFQITSQPNSKNLFQRIKETRGVITYNGSKICPAKDLDTFIQAIKDINDEKYVVEIPKPDPYKTITIVGLKDACRAKGLKGWCRLSRADLITLVKDNGGLPQPA